MAEKREPVEVTEAEWGERPVFTSDDYGHQYGYFASIQDLREWCDDEGTPPPATVHGTSPNPLSMNAEWIVESALEDDHYEDAFGDIGHGEIQRLQAFLDEWCAAQKIVSYNEDRSTIVRLDASLNA